MLCEPREAPGPHEGLYFIYVLRWSSISVFFELRTIEFQASQNSYKNDNLVPSNKKENRNSIKNKKKKKEQESLHIIILQEGQWMCDMNKDAKVRKISLLSGKMSQDWDHHGPVQRGGDLPCPAGSKALMLAMAIEIMQSLFSPTLPLWQFSPCSEGLNKEMGMHWFSSSEPLENSVSSAKLLQSSACFKSQLYMASDMWFIAFTGRRACFGSDRLS